MYVLNILNILHKCVLSFPPKLSAHLCSCGDAYQFASWTPVWWLMVLFEFIEVLLQPSPTVGQCHGPLLSHCLAIYSPNPICP